MKTILCSIDLSAFSPAVLRYGAGFARRFGARLAVFHAVYSADDQLHPTPLFERGGGRGERGAAALAVIHTLMKDLPVAWDPFVRGGEPVEALNRAVGESRADMVIAASHGLGGLRRLLLGRVVERMVRTATQPLLVLRGEGALAPGGGEAATVALRSVLVGCGTDSGDRTPLAWGTRIANGFGGALSVLHAMEAPEPEDAPDSFEGSYAELENDRQQRLRERLRARLPHPSAGCRSVDILLAQGPPAEALMAQAARQATDLLVVGVRRQSGIRRVVVGSTTEAALRHSPCPVLVVPEPGPARGVRRAGLE